ncbi:MAG: hypothetical protein LBQ77_02030 [Treponema sp.]|jgi:hypothetical protein|nr:hypothetical protein [Treponema sp.]
MTASKKSSLRYSLIAYICIALYVFLIGFTVFEITSDNQRCHRIAQQEFFAVSDIIENTVQTDDLDTETFKVTVETALNESTMLQAIIVAGSAQVRAFERETGKSIAWSGDRPRFIHSFGIAENPLLRLVALPNQRNGAISALYRAFDTTAIIRILKKVLIALLLPLMLSFITLILYLKQKNTDSQKGEEDIFVETFNESPTFETVFSDAAESSPKKLEQPSPSTSEKETYARLETELKRCIVFNQDIVFILMEFKEMHFGDEKVCNLLYEEAVNFFLLVDLVFIYGKRNIAVIIPGADLDDGRERVSRFQRTVVEKYSEIFWEISDLCIGLTSRNERMVNAEYLIREASVSLKKALLDPENPIVAFRSDPEKFKAFMDSR